MANDNYNLPLLIGAIDQGTSSSRFLVFNGNSGEMITFAQKEIKMHCPQQSWVEIDPEEILQSVLECIEEAMVKLTKLGFHPRQIAAVGLTNQRETTIAWDKISGKALHNAIVWLDGRTAQLADRLTEKAPGKSKDALRELCGLPIHPYFSALKLRWMMENVDAVKEAVHDKRCLAGNVDAWLIWHLTGRAVHCTDCTNASRTMLMNLKTLQWDNSLLEFFDIPRELLPEIRSSSEVYGYIKDGTLSGVPIAGCLGDQQAALVGSNCLTIHSAKNTYGTGCFLLYNTGSELINSKHGLISTVAYKFGSEAPCYALEGSIAVAGLAVRWLRDNLKIIDKSEDIESLAMEVDGSHGVVFVPAFSGLFAPYWRQDARGLICGLTQYSTKAHIARAVLEAVALQIFEIIEAMQKDICHGESKSSILLKELKADGGMSVNKLLMQIQADVLGTSLVRPQMCETTAFGAAIAAGCGIGALKAGAQIFEQQKPDKSGLDELLFEKLVSKTGSTTFHPQWTESQRSSLVNRWRDAIQKTLQCSLDGS